MRMFPRCLAALCCALLLGAAHAERVYVVGTEATFAPFESMNEQQQIVGFDADLIQAIADKAGFRIKLVNTPWEALFTGLRNGDRDIVAAAVTITSERKRTMDFSAPYFEARQLIITAQDNKVDTLAHLAGRKIGVQGGTSGDALAQQRFGKTSSNIRRFDSIVQALEALRAAQVEAVIADNGVVRNYLVENPGARLRLVDDPAFEKEYYGIAVKKGNKALLERINRGLAAIKADGTYQKIHLKYFGK
ncbi:basic amino acid ABC transporter substrate-binding protein [Chitiniphilus shinanonensis]|uniref:Basic amino acid ABC transporter substrate-binding protein n=1 Tax=Chitiniphilus shinanonensis TaxID=553088 RepID=A0ABQ6BM56_9NEIS|nr:basic amino acid ABC transporter substrate-binding protein [Chitiniphilus shinanonensis]GLS03085.1 basic amino acid ABC transporter substrate-binding protein [Chitiniphilus shinanonensis]